MQPIDAERLDAMPYTRYCIACAAAVGPGVDVNLNFGRPRTPRDTLAPEGAMQEDWRAQTVAADRCDRAAHGGDGSPCRGRGRRRHGRRGFAGSNAGHGDPSVSELQDAAANSAFDLAEARDVMHREAPNSGRSGGRGRRHAGPQARQIARRVGRLRAWPVRALRRRAAEAEANCSRSRRAWL